MKGKHITYWICTGLVCALMAFSACVYLTHAPKIMAVFAHLGYPSFFPNLLGIAKLLGVVALLVPGAAVLKEWAYAGFTITFISAFISHLSAGDGPMAFPPLVALGVLAVSYFTRPAARRVVCVAPVGKSAADRGVVPSRPAHS